MTVKLESVADSIENSVLKLSEETKLAPFWTGLFRRPAILMTS